MGYNLTKRSVKRNLPQLEQLMESQASLSFPATNPRTLAYKLREAIKAAGEHDEYRHIHETLHGRVVFKEREGVVLAVWQGPGEVGMPLESHERMEHERPVPGSSAPPKPDRKTLRGAAHLVDVIGAALKFDSEVEIWFPEAHLRPEERHKLWKWTQKLEIEWQLIDHSPIGEGVTLTKRDVHPDILWRPEE